MLPQGYARGDYARRSGKFQAMLDAQDAKLATLRTQLKDAEDKAENMMQVWRDYRYCGQEWGDDCPISCSLHSVCPKMEEAYRAKYGEVE